MAGAKSYHRIVLQHEADQTPGARRISGGRRAGRPERDLERLQAVAFGRPPSFSQATARHPSDPRARGDSIESPRAPDSLISRAFPRKTGATFSQRAPAARAPR